MKISSPVPGSSAVSQLHSQPCPRGSMGKQQHGQGETKSADDTGPAVVPMFQEPRRSGESGQEVIDIGNEVGEQRVRTSGLDQPCPAGLLLHVAKPVEGGEEHTAGGDGPQSPGGGG